MKSFMMPATKNSCLGASARARCRRGAIGDSVGDEGGDEGDDDGETGSMLVEGGRGGADALVDAVDDEDDSGSGDDSEDVAAGDAPVVDAIGFSFAVTDTLPLGVTDSIILGSVSTVESGTNSSDDDAKEKGWADDEDPFSFLSLSSVSCSDSPLSSRSSAFPSGDSSSVGRSVGLLAPKSVAVSALVASGGANNTDDESDEGVRVEGGGEWWS